MNRLSAFILMTFLSFGMTSKVFSAIINVTGVSFPSPTANNCTNTFVDVNMQINCINAVYNGSSVNIAGSVITVNVDYTMGAICLGALSFPVHNINMGMIPAGSYSVVVNGIENSAVVSTVTSSLVVTRCCAVIAAFTVPNDTVCEGGSKLFTNASTASMHQKWFVNGVLADTNTDFQHQFTQSGTFAIKLVANDSTCADSVTKNVTIHALPSVDLGNDTTLCVGDTLLLDVSHTGWTYKWQDNSTNGTYEVTDSGQYIVAVQDVYGCPGADTVNIALDPCGVGIQEVLNEGIQIAPNPSKGTFNLTFNHAVAGEIQIRIFSVTGNLVYNQKHRINSGRSMLRLNLTEQQSGLYFLQLTNRDKTEILRLVIE